MHGEKGAGCARVGVAQLGGRTAVLERYDAEVVVVGAGDHDVVERRADGLECGLHGQRTVAAIVLHASHALFGHNDRVLPVE